MDAYRGGAYPLPDDTQPFDTNASEAAYTAKIDHDGVLPACISDSSAVRPTYPLSYQWNLPEGAEATLPGGGSYYAGDPVTLDSTCTSDSAVKAGHDTYTFSGWTTVTPALADGKMPASAVTVSGTWAKQEAPALQVEKDVSDTSVRVGSTVIYTITVITPGNVDLKNVAVAAGETEDGEWYTLNLPRRTLWAAAGFLP